MRKRRRQRQARSEQDGGERTRDERCEERRPQAMRARGRRLLQFRDALFRWADGHDVHDGFALRDSREVRFDRFEGLDDRRA